MTTIFSDRELSQKLERAEARSNADFVETRARLSPEVGAEWVDVGGTYAMFDGAESPCTQTFGLGLFDEATDASMEMLEEFFATRGAPVFHEVSPMADPALMPLLSERGYRPIEMTSVMFRPLDAASPSKANPDIATRVIEPDEVDLWARTSAAGWATEHESLADFMYGFGRVGAQCRGAFPFIAELGGKAISTGSLFIHGDVAMLAGASTIPEGRNRGAQSALLDARLRFAAEKGCTLAVMGASPGSQSQKNAQKNGFQIAYTRTKWQLFP
jgi:GNAT superfamily N-acetyltransferase